MSVDLVRIIDSIHRDKNIPTDILFEGIESALQTAAKKHFPEDGENIVVEIDRASGEIRASRGGVKMDPAELGRIAAQTAKQVIIQKIREAERDSLFDEFEDQRGDLVTGTVQRFEGGAVLVNLGKTDALLPRSEQIPGESHHPNERIRAVILDVRKVGQRVKIILSRTHPDFVRRLFELEIPEIQDQTISIRALAREAGYRSKVAVSSIDAKVDAVGACVGVRGTRIKNIVDELGGERIDIVRWNESLQVLIPNALQPAEIDEVMLCQLLGRAIVLVREDQLSLAIGRRGQNVRLASKLVGWDIEIMTSEELDELIEKAVTAFNKIDGVDTDLAEKLVEQGILSYDDLSVMEISDLVNTIEGLTEELTTEIVAQAEKLAEEQAEEMPRRKGASAKLAPVETASSEGTAADSGDNRQGRAAQPTLDELFGAGAGDISTLDHEPSTDADDHAETEAAETADDEDGEMRDLALAAETLGGDEDGHEVTGPPSDSDQTETERIVTDAVAAGAPPHPLQNHETGAGVTVIVPPLPPTEPFSTNPVEGRESEMQEP